MNLILNSVCGISNKLSRDCSNMGQLLIEIYNAYTYITQMGGYIFH